MSNLAKHSPNDFLPQIAQAITEITHKPTRAEALNGYLPRLPLPHSRTPTGTTTFTFSSTGSAQTSWEI